MITKVITHTFGCNILNGNFKFTAGYYYSKNKLYTVN